MPSDDVVPALERSGPVTSSTAEPARRQTSSGHDIDPVGGELPAVSVVVPTYDRLDLLRQVLEALADQDISEPYEVIVVSDGSTDGTDEYLNGDDPPLPIVAISQPNGGPASARNAGIERAASDLVVFIDDDVVADRALLRTHLEQHRRHGSCAVVIGPMLDPPGVVLQPWVEWEQRMLQKQYRAMQAGLYRATARQFYTGNASVRLEHLREIGGFDTTFRRAEDVELAFRLSDAGLTFHFEPSAIGYHHARRSYEGWRSTAATYGRNEIVFARDLGRSDVFDFVAASLRRRNPMLRWAVGSCLRHPLLWTVTTSLLERVVRTPRRVARRPARWALSGLYALEYSAGLAEELGGVDALRELESRPAPD